MNGSGYRPKKFDKKQNPYKKLNIIVYFIKIGSRIISVKRNTNQLHFMYYILERLINNIEIPISITIQKNVTLVESLY